MGRNILAVALFLWLAVPAGSAGPLSSLAPDRVAPVAMPPQSPASAAWQTPGFHFYFPIVKLPARLEAVTTASGEYSGYPTDYYLYGYVRNLTTEPFYAVAVNLEVTIYPYTGPAAQRGTEIVQVTPALSATLPGQVNPFSYNLLLGKATATVGPVRGVSGSTTGSGMTYDPLTVLGSSYSGTTLTGTVKNETGHPLYHSRVVAAEPLKCAWREAVLGAQTIPPGGETSFSIPNYAAICVSEALILVGQGATLP